MTLQLIIIFITTSRTELKYDGYAMVPAPPPPFSPLFSIFLCSPQPVVGDGC